MADLSTSRFVPRIVSGAVLAPVVIALVWTGGWPFTLLVALAAVIMTQEWDRLCRGPDLGPVGLVSGMAALLAVVLAGLALYPVALAVVVVGAAVAGGLAAVRGRPFSWSALGLIYAGVPCVALVWLRAATPGGFELVLWLFLAVWAADIGAYAAGRTIGGAKLAPRVSPGKTWAGLAGGIVAAAATGVAFALATGVATGTFLAVVSALVAVVAQAGDLAESALKRRFEVKDSGRLIPGHGGILDRVDGLVFASVAVGGLTLFGGGQTFAWR